VTWQPWRVMHVTLAAGVLWTTKAENMKIVATGNLVLSLCIGFHYFIKVWSPAMHGNPPSTSQAGPQLSVYESA